MSIPQRGENSSNNSALDLSIMRQLKEATLE